MSDSVGPFHVLRRRNLRVPSGKFSKRLSNQERNASRYVRRLCGSVSSSNCGSIAASTKRPRNNPHGRSAWCRDVLPPDELEPARSSCGSSGVSHRCAPSRATCVQLKISNQVRRPPFSPGATTRRMKPRRSSTSTCWLTLSSVRSAEGATCSEQNRVSRPALQFCTSEVATRKSLMTSS